MKNQINKASQLVFSELKKIGSVRHYLTAEATKLLLPLVASPEVTLLDWAID